MARNLGAFLPGAKGEYKLAAEFEHFPFSGARLDSLSVGGGEAAQFSTSFSRRSISRWRSSVVWGSPFFLLHSAITQPLNRLLAADAADGSSSSGFTRIRFCDCRDA